jgi:CheY-like chemotaxis protein
MGTDVATIYIVDDDPAVREALSSLLRASGKNVRLFTSGAEFLSFEREDTPACLILDLKMPGLSGLAVQRFLSATIPIIFITGRGDVDRSRTRHRPASNCQTRRASPCRSASALSFAHAARAGGPSTSCEGQTEQTNCGGAGNHRIHSSDPPRQYLEPDEVSL